MPTIVANLLEVPHITIPAPPGRNAGTVEIATLDQKSKDLGIDSARKMNAALRQRVIPREDDMDNK